MGRPTKRADHMRQRRLNETNEVREKHLSQQKKSTSRTISQETCEERKNRLSKMRLYMKKVLIRENIEKRSHRLGLINEASYEIENCSGIAENSYSNLTVGHSEDTTLENKHSVKNILPIVSENEVQDSNENKMKNSQKEKTAYRCTICTYKSSNLEMFTLHLKVHSKILHYKCSECKHTFETRESIESHVKTVHNAPEIYYDNHQLEKYIENECIESEQILTDIGTKNKLCNKCLQNFDNEESVLTHMCKKDIFKCGFCSKVFPNKSSMINHFKASKEKVSRCCTEFQKNVKLQSNPNTIIRKSDGNKVDSSISSLEQNLLSDNSTGTGCKNDCVKSPLDADNLLLQKVTQNFEPDMDMIDVSKTTNIKNSNVTPSSDESETKTKMILETELKCNSNNCKTTILDNSLQQNNNIDKSVSKNLIDFNNIVVKDTGMARSDTEITNDCLISQQNAYDLKLPLPSVKENNTKDTNLKENSKKQFSTDKVYICPICGLNTSSQTHMTSHFKCHITLEKKRYKCHICNRILTTHSNLKRHLTNHEKCKSGQVYCQYCNERLVDRIHYKQHIEEQHQESFKCMYCEKTFPNKKLCREHELSHPERATFKCNVCGQMFKTEGRLKNHKELIHNDMSDLFSENKIFKCHICFKTLTTYHNLKRHIRNHEKCSGSVPCNICSEELTDRIHLRQHIEDKHPETYQCSFCNKVFTSLASCKNHEVTHPERLIYKCDSCDKMFPSELRLDRHKSLLHRDPVCRTCGKEILNRAKLIEHEKRHERHKQQFTCKECPKVFRTPAGLKYHMSVHTGIYAVYCEICGKGLHSEVVLEEHKATHTKEVRYMCELCGRKFSSNSTYRMHRLWHDNPLPYQCNICERKFKHTSILAVHKRRAHTGERPYKCEVCSLTFSVSSTLNKHMILHTKQYPYKCEQCSKGFTTRTKISRHLAKVHNDYTMLNSQKKTCEYKMVLRPSEMYEVQQEITHVEETKDTELNDLQQVVVEIDADLYNILEQERHIDSDNRND